MNWYKKAKKSGKTKRHDKSNVALYHISPNKLTRLSPRSTFYNIAGAFVSPSYKSIINDWMWYVKNKKHEKHKLNPQWQELHCKLIVLEKKQRDNPSEFTERDQKELESIDERIDKLSDTMDGKEYQKSIEGYKTIYIHKISCPRDVYKKALDFFDKAYESGYKQDQFGFWGWGKQVFIPQEDLPQCKIIGVEELNDSQMHEKYQDLSIRRYMR